MKGARFVTAAESEKDHGLAENLIKQMAGDDIISARFLYQDTFEFEPEYSGILNWAIKGWLEWQKNGLGIPVEVTEATNEYRNEMDLQLNNRCNWQ